MIVQISDEIQFEVQDDCFVLQKKSVGKKGITWIGYKYFTKLENLIKAVIQKKLAESDKKLSLIGFLEEYKKVSSQVRTSLPEGLR